MKNPQIFPDQLGCFAFFLFPRFRREYSFKDRISVARTIDEQYPVITGKFKRHIFKIESYFRVPGLRAE
jgi:hypothetical protein